MKKENLTSKKEGLYFGKCADKLIKNKSRGNSMKTIVFDIGKVLADFKWEEYIEARELPKEEKEKLKKATVLASAWNEQDRGVLSKEEVRELLCNGAPELAEEITLFLRHIIDMIEEYPYSARWVQALKKEGYQVLLLSNYGEDSFLEGRKQFTFYPFVDGEVISYQYKVVKPERKIYEILIEKFQLNPEDTVFIDDKEENIQAAIECGIHGIVYHSLDQAIEELHGLGVRVCKEVFQ